MQDEEKKFIQKNRKQWRRGRRRKYFIIKEF